jgi:hypothetical protein
VQVDYWLLPLVELLALSLARDLPQSPKSSLHQGMRTPIEFGLLSPRPRSTSESPDMAGQFNSLFRQGL